MCLSSLCIDWCEGKRQTGVILEDCWWPRSQNLVQFVSPVCRLHTMNSGYVSRAPDSPINKLFSSNCSSWVNYHIQINGLSRWRPELFDVHANSMYYELQILGHILQPFGSVLLGQPGEYVIFTIFPVLKYRFCGLLDLSDLTEVLWLPSSSVFNSYDPAYWEEWWIFRTISSTLQSIPTAFHPVQHYSFWKQLYFSNYCIAEVCISLEWQ